MNIALIIGCARSGTSILGELLSSHPDVRYIFEAHNIWEIAGPGENNSHRLTQGHATPCVIKSVRKWFLSQQGSARLLVEKNPRNILRVPYIKKIFPEAKIIHIVRDGRDVTCSLLPGIGGTAWWHLKPPTWERLISEEPISRCAQVWNETIQIALEDLDSVPHLLLKYEDLISFPEKAASNLFAYLGLKNHVAVMEYCKNIQNSTQDSYQAQHQSFWYRDDHTARIGRWKENLTPEQKVIVENILSKSLARLGYSDRAADGTTGV